MSDGCVASQLKTLVRPPEADKPQEGSHTHVYAPLSRRRALYPPQAGLLLNMIRGFETTSE